MDSLVNQTPEGGENAASPFIEFSLAESPQGEEQQQKSGNPLGGFLPLILIVVVFYFFLIRPQMRKQKELKTYREALQKGDRVVTTGGIYGKIINIADNNVEVEIAHGVVIKVDKFAILKDSTDLANQK